MNDKHDFYSDIGKGTCTCTITSAIKQKVFTVEMMQKAVEMLKDLPPMPEIYYAPHLEDDDAYEFDNTQISPFLGGALPERLITVGKNVAKELIEKGIEVKNYNEDEDEHGNN